MEFDIQSLFGLHVHSCTHWLRTRPPPHPPALGLIYEGAIGVSQDRRHLFVTPCVKQPERYPMQNKQFNLVYRTRN
jgi:hypothetical protein